jgi:hypothetical protein
MSSPTRYEKTVIVGLPVLLAASLFVRLFTHGVVSLAGAAAYMVLAFTMLVWTWRHRSTRRIRHAPVEPPSTPRLELNAPNPVPSQCPVCGLTDLDERAVGDEVLGDGGTALARVVAYGPWRAHSECAAVVPYAAQTSDYLVRGTPQTPPPPDYVQPAASRALVGHISIDLQGLELAALRMRLPVTGASRERMWRQYGFTAREALRWYQAGFTPWSAEYYRIRWGSLAEMPAADRQQWAEEALAAERSRLDRSRREP